MKITKEHYNQLREMIARIYPELADYKLAIIAQGKAKDVDKRVRWDALNAVGGTRFICDNLYSYLNDEHIDSALRAIMKELGVQS